MSIPVVVRGVASAFIGEVTGTGVQALATSIANRIVLSAGAGADSGVTMRALVVGVA